MCSKHIPVKVTCKNQSYRQYSEMEPFLKKGLRENRTKLYIDKLGWSLEENGDGNGRYGIYM